MSLLKTSVLNGIAVGTRMGAGLILNKILAIYVGPIGYAVIGQLQNVISITTTFASGAINVGVTKYTAEFHDQPVRLRSLWRTAGTITVIGALLIAILIASFRDYISINFLNDARYSAALAWLASCLLFISINALFLAILAGQKEVKRYVAANISGALISLIFSGLLARQYGLTGVLAALSLGQAISLIATATICCKLTWFRIDQLIGKIDWDVAGKLGHYVLMAITTAVTVPVSQILIRGHIQEVYSPIYAGYWDAINKISTVYLTLATTTLSLYYLPRIAQVRQRHELMKEIWECFRVVVPIVIAASTLLFILRANVVAILFAPDFMPMTGMMGWQVLGDVLKIASWVFSYVIVGQSRTKAFIATEIVFSFSLYVFTIICMRLMGPSGATAAYALNYALYLLTMYLLVWVKKN